MIGSVERAGIPCRRAAEDLNPLSSWSTGETYAAVPQLLGLADAVVNATRGNAADKVVYEAAAACLPVFAASPVFDSLLPDALRVMAAWGFTYKAVAVWVKPSIGPGVWFRPRSELLLLGVRGGWPPPDPEERCEPLTN